MNGKLKIGLIVSGAVLSTLLCVKVYERIDPLVTAGYEQRCLRSDNEVYCTFINKQDPRDVVFVASNGGIERHFMTGELIVRK